MMHMHGRTGVVRAVVLFFSIAQAAHQLTGFDLECDSFGVEDERT